MCLKGPENWSSLLHISIQCNDELLKLVSKHYQTIDL